MNTISQRVPYHLTFPVEVWVLILHHVHHPPDLAHLARICRSLRYEVEGVLYQAVSVGPNLTTVHRFSVTVCECERRAAYVKTLKLRIAAYRRVGDVSLVGVVCRALLALVRLDYLKLKADDIRFLRPFLERQLANIRLPALRRLNTDLPYHASMLQFLKNHPHLQEMKIDTSHSELQWSVPNADPPLVLSNLRKVTCRSALFRHLTSPTPLTHLYLLDYVMLALPQAAQLFGNSLVSLRLGVPRTLLGRPLQWSLADIAAGFPRLRLLRMDEYQQYANLSGREFVWDSGTVVWTPSPTAPGLTLIWVAMWTPESESEMADHIQTTVTSTSRDLLLRWSPYLLRVVFWFDVSERTYTAFSTDVNKGVAVGHDPAFDQKRWMQI
ncbi:hypothetical protein C8Q79DRAFT_985701 [Trametes meyenii]|nr:hypothetical protein C8Q79DRAFT_985701 [Trametes meyenii]